MKLKTDSNALLTAAAFGTATFMMVALNQNGSTGVANIDNAEASAQRFARGIEDDGDASEYADQCSTFVMDGGDCPDTDDQFDQADEDLDDVEMFQDARKKGKGKGKSRVLAAVGNYWINPNKAAAYARLMGGFTDQIRRATTRRSPKQAPVSLPEAAILPAGSPWFDGEFDYLNDKVNPETLDMTEYTLRAFNIFYPQTIPYDIGLSLDRAQELWGAYRSFIAELYYLISEGTKAGIGNQINLTGYTGTTFRAFFRKTAREVNAFTGGVTDPEAKRRMIKTALDASAFGTLARDGFHVPTRKGRAGTMALSQPRYKNTVEFWRKDYIKKDRNYQSMQTTTQTCVTVYMMHDIFQDASILDNWFLGGTQKFQNDNRDNLKTCVVIPVMIHGNIEGVSEWMDSAISAMVPNVKKYAQQHPGKKQYHKHSYTSFIQNWRSVAADVASWTSAYANRGQCLSTVDPNDFLAEEDVIEPTAGTTTTTTAGTTTTDWTTTNSETTETNPFRDLETDAPEDYDVGNSTESPPEDQMCCFGTINSPTNTYSACIESDFDETLSFF